MRERNFTLPANASPAQVREFVSFWRGCVVAVEPLRHVLDSGAMDKLVDAYIADMTTVLDALELEESSKTEEA
jgi:hypothetical protein